MKLTACILAATLLLTAAGASAQTPVAVAHQVAARSYTQRVAGGGSITYFEAVPSHDAQHAQFAQLRQVFAATRPTLVFYEKPDMGVDSTEAATIRRLGESGYARFLAQQHQVPTEHLESTTAEYAYLQTKVEAEQLKLYYLLRQAAQFRQATGASKALTAEAMQQLIANSRYFLPGTGGVIHNLAELRAAYRKHCPSSGNWQQAPAAWFGTVPAAASSPLADINRLACEFRTDYLTRKLAASAQAGQRVLVVLAPGHGPTAPTVASLGYTQ